MKAIYREDILDEDFFMDYLGVVSTVKKSLLKMMMKKSFIFIHPFTICGQTNMTLL